MRQSIVLSLRRVERAWKMRLNLWLYGISGPARASRLGHAMMREATLFSYCSIGEAPPPLVGIVSPLVASGSGTLRERTVAARDWFPRRVRRRRVRRVPWESLSFFFCDAESGPTSWMSEYLVWHPC